MNIQVTVDGKVVYSDRTFKMAEAFDLLQIALTEGQIPEGKVTSVTLKSEGPFPSQIHEGHITYEDGQATLVRVALTSLQAADRDDGVSYPDEEIAEERPALDIFKEGQSCAV